MNQQSGMPNFFRSHWPNFYYGWVIVAVCAVVMTVTAGLGFYNLSVYLKAFVSEQGFSVSLTSGATASFFIASGVTGMLVGSVIDRFDIRWSIAFGAIFCAVTLSMIGWVHTIFQLYLFHILFGMGYTFAALIPCTTLVARWFNKNRSSALAVASTGLSLGGILLTPISVKLISDLGLGGAGPWLGLLFVLAIVPLAIIFLRPSPQSIGLLPDGAALPESGVAPQLDGVPLNIVLRSRFFILSTTAYVFAMMAQVGAISHQFNLASTRTGDDELAAFTIAILGGASIVGRLSGGVLLTYIDSKKFILFLFLLQGASLYLYSEVETVWGLYVTAAIFGITVGNILMMQPLIIAEAFGLVAYGRIYARSQLATTMGVASGPFSVGLAYELAGGYQPAFIILACASLLAFCFMMAAGPVDATELAYKKTNLTGDA